MIFEEKQKSQPIDKRQIWEAFKKVRSNKGACGVDKLSIADVSSHPMKYLYPIWNRLASGSYFPDFVREVEIPKGDGTKRKLGIPTVQDRTAKMVIREELEQIVDKQFSSNSFGYRPNKSAHQAIKQCRQNCMEANWAIDLDIKSFFDEIDHDLMLQALGHFTQERHIHLYVERWLKASVQKKDGRIYPRIKGTPQGGVISPLLANIFLHVVFDKWMETTHPGVKFERYADDIIIHCDHFKQAMDVLGSVTTRFRRCKLEIKEGKSNIVYCKQKQKYHPPFRVRYLTFDFLGFTFKPRMVKGRYGKFYLGFTPSISRKNQKRINQTLCKMNLHRMVYLGLPDLARILRDKIRGWIHYYGIVRKSELHYVFRNLNFRLSHWVRNKYRRFRRKHWFFAYKWLQETAKHYPNLFVHWQYGFKP
ncbi:MAG: group II intron reverse transcriptase/maturase [Flavobacteriales bacterium]|nr:group II intron reverse transcriptase/maturase [Flavobacteriales bacterium]